MQLYSGTEIVKLTGPSGDESFVFLTLSCNTPLQSFALANRAQKETRREGILNQDAYFSISVLTVAVTVISNKPSYPFLSPHTFFHVFSILSSVLSPSQSFYHPEGILALWWLEGEEQKNLSGGNL